MTTTPAPEYVVTQTVHYFAPRRDEETIYSPADGDFAMSLEAARALVAKLDGTVYTTRSGESGRPTYRVRRYGSRRVEQMLPSYLRRR